MSDKPSIPHIGRQSLVEKVLDRLQRPSDLRQSPKEFVQPGFYGLGGLGKSRLLDEIATAARKVTPYVLFFDFATQAAQPAPATPRALCQAIVEQLDAIDLAQRSWWHPLDRQSRFTACRQLLAAPDHAPLKVQASQRASGGGTIEASPLSIHYHPHDAPAIPEKFAEALQKTLPTLRSRAPVRQKFGAAQAPKPCPLILLLFDTLEEAPKPLRSWLPTHLHALLGLPSAHYHAMAVAAGREQVEGWLVSELPPLMAAEAESFLYHYTYYKEQEAQAQKAAGRWSAAERQPFEELRTATPLRQQLVTWGEGVPLFLQTLADGALLDPAGWQKLEHQPQLNHEQRFAYFYHQYLERLRQKASRALAESEKQALWDRYRLLSYAPVPRRLVSAELLRVLLQDLPGTPFTAQSDYERYFGELQQQGAVHDDATGAFRFHALVRDGALQRLRREYPESWRTVQRRAADYFARTGNALEQAYHQAQLDQEAAMNGVWQGLAAALRAENWRAVQSWIGMAEELPLPANDQAWLAFYKAQLAWGEGNRGLATQRVQQLIHNPALAPAQQASVANLLETWFGYNQATTLAQSSAPSLLLWWAQVRGHLPQAATLLRGLGEVALRQAQLGDAQEYYEGAHRLCAQLEDRYGQASALCGLGEVARLQARLGDALGYYEGAHRLSAQIEDRSGQASALRGLGEVALMQDRLGDALGYCEGAHRLCAQLEDRYGQASALSGLGDVALRQDRLGDAQEYYEGAHRLCAQLEDRYGQASALRGLGEVALRQARLDDAQGYYEGAHRLSAQLEDRYGQASALRGLGEVALMQDRLGDAQGYYEGAHRLSAQLEDRYGQASALRGLGEVALMQARLGDALGYYEGAHRLSAQLEDRYSQASALRGLGEVALMQARLGDALGYYEGAHRLSAQLEDRSGQASALRGLGEVALMQARLGDAQGYYEGAHRLSAQLEDRYGQAYALCGLGEVALRQARLDDALADYRRAWELYVTIGFYNDALNNISLVAGNETMDQALQQQEAGQAAAAQALRQLADILYTWGATLLAQLPPETPLGNIPTRMKALQVRLSAPQHQSMTWTIE